MTKSGKREVTRRFITLILLSIGLSTIAHWDWPYFAGFIVFALLFYIFLPRIHSPENAMTYEKIPAVYGPDFVGFFMTSLFIALPFWARAGESYLWEDFVLIPHPAALIVWPLALICVFILYFSAKYACYWLLIEPQALKINSLKKAHDLNYQQISEVFPFRKGLPKWLKLLTPLMVLSGKYTAAGAVMLSRDTTGISLKLESDEIVNIPCEAFEKPCKQLLKRLKKENIKIDANLK